MLSVDPDSLVGFVKCHVVVMPYGGLGVSTVAVDARKVAMVFIGKWKQDSKRSLESYGCIRPEDGAEFIHRLLQKKSINVKVLQLPGHLEVLYVQVTFLMTYKAG